MVQTRSAKKNVESTNMKPDGVDMHHRTSVKSEPVKSQSQMELPRPSRSTLDMSPQHGSAAHPVPTPVQQQNMLDAPAQFDSTRRKVKNSQASTTSNTSAKRKRLQLLAAEQKAKIQMALIDQRLEADLADLEDEYSPLEGDRVSKHTRTEVEKWLERSQHEMETVPHAPANGPSSGALEPLNGIIQQLTTALKQITTSAANNQPNTQLLSRMSVSKDLPEFHGHPLEWLQFKQAYQESSRICGFSDIENVWRLRKCLKGAAKEAVSALLICATSPDELLSTLELRFGNPDVILFHITQDLKKLQPLSLDYQKDIVPFSVKIKNFVTAVHAVGREECLRGVHLTNIIISKLPTILVSKWCDHSFPLLKDGSVKSRMDIMSDFLTNEAIKVTTSANIITLDNNYKNVKRESNVRSSHAVLVQSTDNKEGVCSFCKKSCHKLTECKLFKKALRRDRWRHVKRHGLCYKCILAHHERATCPAPACDADGCEQNHHRMLHIPHRVRDSNGTASDPVVTTETVTHIGLHKCAVLLKVVPINIHCANGQVVHTAALLDDGSTVSLISSDLAARAGLRGRRESLHVRGAWNSTSLVCESEIVNVSVSSSTCNSVCCNFTSLDSASYKHVCHNMNSEILKFNARSVNQLDLPVQTLLNCKNYKHLIKLRDKVCLGLLKPEILIGQDNYHLLMPLESIVGAVNEPCATRTPLGWCLHGRVARAAIAPQQGQHSSLLITSDNEERKLQVLQDQVSHFFSIESLGITAKPRQNVEDLRASEILEQTSTLSDGKWYVGLPWKDTNCKMPDTLPMALTRLRGVEQKMKKNEDYARRYRERIDHLFDNEYARQLSDEEVGSAAIKNPKTWYLPHFGVDNPNKKKLRLVFDAAAQTNGRSLNDYLLKGIDLLQSLLGIMFRFRENKVGVTGDIQDMFLRVKIITKDQDALRFLFRDTDGSLKTNVMTSLIFGANCSPFIAQYVKNKNAERFQKEFPLAADAIINSHYMDDYIDSIPDEKSAMELVRDVSYIHSQGNFHIRNWTTNSEALLKSLPQEHLGETAKTFTSGQQQLPKSERTLGLIWEPLQDILKIDISFKRIPQGLLDGKEKPTKREMLRVVMSIFDIYGILGPVTITGRIILRQCWEESLSWDTRVSAELNEKWHRWLQLLSTLHDVGLPRYYGVAGAFEGKKAVSQQCAAYSSLQLHVFCDASSQAMNAVAYWRWQDNGNCFVAFIASRSRVAKVKATTIPRMELQAAVLAARLADTIVREHRIKPQGIFFWSDSTTVLYWIKNNAKNYKTFVANRLGEVDELTKPNEWRYVPTKLNVADKATRESYDASTLQGEWLHGPAFLRDSEDDWPNDVTQSEVDNSQLEHACVVTLDKAEFSVPDPTRFSSWLKLVRAMYTVLKFISKLRKSPVDDFMLMESAERRLFRYSQAQAFSEEIWKIKNGEPLAKCSKLLTLTPYLDSHGILRVAGRIDAAAEVAAETKHPIILDGADHIARLIVRAYHVKAAHGNQELVVNELKQKYWIIKLRPTVKNVVAKCMLCRVKKSKPEIPRMGDLPEARMAHHQRPFTFCGVDLFGPLEVTVGRSRLKRYGVLFTCMTVRAVHVELVTSLTTDAFIMALRRMAARRGWPQQLFSDNGTNLRGADEELKKSMAPLQKAFADEALKRGVKWTFIPPASPHWGGAWERLIRSVKTTLKVVLQERAPREETLYTLLVEVENMVNSRPLTHVSVEPGSSEALTPNHFLIGSSSNLPRLGVFDDKDIYLRKQWRISQRLADMFWNRWVREVLPEMMPRKKWLVEQRSLQVGDLVFIADPNSPRNTWPRGLIEEVFPGKDGRVRMVRIKTQLGVLTRSATRVLRIPIGDKCC